MPVLFTGHGSPMNIIETNRFTETFKNLGSEIGNPKAILCVSAHWLTSEPLVLIAEQPRQIFDFQGFPRELYEILYRPPGAPSVAREVLATNQTVKGDNSWGLDHGTWSVLHHMFPEQQVPCFQLSLSTSYSLREHMKLAKELGALSTKGVLIIGSGNIVHNLREVSFDPNAEAKPWALDFENFVLKTLSDNNLSTSRKLESIFNSPELKIAHPSVDHLLPLIYSLAASREDSAPIVECSGIQNGSISMATIRFPA